MLLEATAHHSVGDLQKVVAYWRRAVEREQTGREEQIRPADLHASVTLEGMVRVDGDLDPETGESLLSALHAYLDAEARSRTDEDRRNPAQRRADALAEICRGWPDRADRPTVAGEPPHVSVTIGADVLRGVAVSPCELDHTGPVAPDTARRIACDASVRRVVLSGAPSRSAWDGRPRWSPPRCGAP